jgi:acetyltransferase-like isoleucine patch superfamily enzyme
MKDASDIEKALELLSGGDAAKAGLLRELLATWASDGLKVLDGDRQRALRPEILRRLLGLALTDDERAVLNGLPAGCRMRENAKIISPEKLKCGEHVWIGEGAVLDASGGLEIGSHTSVGLSVFVWSHSSHLTNLSMQNETASALIQRKPTKIGSGCFIAGPSVILPGVTIGDRVLIRPFSTVSNDVPDGSMVDGATVTEGVFTEAVIGRLVKQQLVGRR